MTMTSFAPCSIHKKSTPAIQAVSDYQDATQKLLAKLQEGTFKPPTLLRPKENDNPKYVA